jgi:uncharacterized protein YxjI
MLLGTSRPFKLHIRNADGTPFIEVDRPWKFYHHELTVTDVSAGVYLGQVKRRFSMCTREFDIFDSQGRLLFQVHGPMFQPWTFNVTIQGQQIGVISKKFSGFIQEAFTDADNFGVEFPQDLPVAPKALLLATVFLIDFMYSRE